MRVLRQRGLFSLISLNILVFLLDWGISVFSKDGDATHTLTTGMLCVASNFHLYIQHPWTILTYMVTQFSPLHLLFNMLWLFCFGNMLSDEKGNKTVVTAYVGGGVAGGIFYLAVCGIWPALSATGAFLCGASAAVLSVMTSVTLIHPDKRVRLLPSIECRLKWVFLICLVPTFFGIGEEGDLAGCCAHLGGIAYGWIMAMATRLRQSHKLSAASVSDTTGSADTERLDSLLDKINRSGYPSLSSGERAELAEISQRLNSRPININYH